MRNFAFVLFSWLVLLLRSSAAFEEGSDFNLGKLHWCQTKCLCHDDSSEILACFEDEEIYSLMNIETKMIRRLVNKSGFVLAKSLTWCNETCLCHKKGQKTFKCSDNQRLNEFIKEKKPSIAHYLGAQPEPEPEPEDIIHDVTDISEIQQNSDEIRERHEKKKMKKHRKNKKKNHLKKEEVSPPVISSTAAAHVDTEQVPLDDEVHDTSSPEVITKAVLRASIGRDVSSKLPSSSEVEVPLKRKIVSDKISEDLNELRENINRVKTDVALNQYILLVTVAFSSLALVGVIIIAIYTCCLRKSKSSKHSISKSQRNEDMNHEDNITTKVNLTDQAW